MHASSFVTQEGGTGKSTLAVNLAAVAGAAGEKVRIVDLDTQGTAAGWYGTRVAETPAVLGHDQVEDLQRTPWRLEAAGFSLAILDTPGDDSHATLGAMRAADPCPIPVRPSEADAKATMPTINALDCMGREFALVINQAPVNEQAKSTAAVTMRMSSEGPVSPLAVASRVDHQRARALGQGDGEHGPAARPRRRSPASGPAAGKDSR